MIALRALIGPHGYDSGVNLDFYDLVVSSKAIGNKYTMPLISENLFIN
jgi:hypothetical protein